MSKYYLTQICFLFYAASSRLGYLMNQLSYSPLIGGASRLVHDESPALDSETKSISFHFNRVAQHNNT